MSFLLIPHRYLPYKIHTDINDNVIIMIGAIENENLKPSIDLASKFFPLSEIVNSDKLKSKFIMIPTSHELRWDDIVNSFDDGGNIGYYKTIYMTCDDIVITTLRYNIYVKFYLFLKCYVIFLIKYRFYLCVNDYIGHIQN